MPVPFALEQQVAIASVRRACALTMTVFNKLVAGETLVKDDKSPVTGTLRCYNSARLTLYRRARAHGREKPCS
jgi:hypothetical protein